MKVGSQVTLITAAVVFVPLFLILRFIPSLGPELAVFWTGGIVLVFLAFTCGSMGAEQAPLTAFFGGLFISFYAVCGVILAVLALSLVGVPLPEKQPYGLQGPNLAGISVAAYLTVFAASYLVARVKTRRRSPAPGKLG